MGFLDESFQIGPGVLIPRPETELLALTTLQRLESWEHPVVFDLCAGSGCLGLSIAKRRPDAEVFLLENQRPHLPIYGAMQIVLRQLTPICNWAI